MASDTTPKDPSSDGAAEGATEAAADAEAGSAVAATAAEPVAVEAVVAEPVAVVAEAVAAEPIAVEALVVAPNESTAPSPEGEAKRPAPASAEPVSPAKEWAAAVALMILFALIALQFVSFLRNYSGN